MKRQERDQLRQKSKAELLKDIEALQRELVTSRMTKDQRMMANVHENLSNRKKVAILKTFVAQKDK